MRKKLIILFLLIGLFIGTNTSATAMVDEQANAIQSFIDEARRISRAPGISVAIQVDGESHFFSSGLANREMGMSATEETLWELASVSKAFTALGLLYLEEQGLLSLTDSIADHLPWLTFRYRGQPVDMQDVRLYNFLYHTVGITNMQHPNLVLDRPGPDTLQNTVEALIDAELVFFPGERMEYGTKNYNVLGLVIESVSEQSYESFMEEQIFQPLGLTQTFANRDHAIATNRLAQGYFTTFIFATRQRDSAEARGSVPTGYIITSAQDMARWMGIQLGLIEDIPAVFKEIIPRSHIGDQSVEPENLMGWYTYYAAGWIVSVDGERVEHEGGNPSFATYILLLPEEQIGVAVLSNSRTTNTMPIANHVVDILGGNLGARYPTGIIQMLDMVLTIATVFGSIIAIYFFLLGLHRKQQDNKLSISGKRGILIALWSVITLMICVLPYAILRVATGVNLRDLLHMLMPYSLLTGFIALVLLSASITWFVAFPRRTK